MDSIACRRAKRANGEQVSRHSWRFVESPPLSGSANMACDLETLQRVQQNGPPVLRLFRWSHPTVSYGRHQRLTPIRSLIPMGWDTVQRPTGGGLVYHEDDLCLSLCWRRGDTPLPLALKDVYAWIHAQLCEALRPFLSARLASCQDCRTDQAPFETRHCFEEPVAYDILSGARKVAGGALCRQKDALLYQGSIQNVSHTNLAASLMKTFQQALQGSPAVLHG